MFINNCMGCKKHIETLSLRAEVKRFETGVEYQRLEKMLQKKDQAIERCNDTIARRNNLIKQLRSDIDVLHKKLNDREDQLRKLTIANEYKDDLLSSMDFHIITDLNTRIHQLENQNDLLNQQMFQKDGMILKLQAQVNRDCTNSSKPSSQDPNHKIIHNNRPETNRRPGGQPGHEGHRRKFHKPTLVVKLDPPDEVVDNPEYFKTGRTITKQLIKASIVVEVIQYEADEYQSNITRKRKTAKFPAGINNEVEYDASVEALATLLHSHGNVSYDKIKEMLSDLTGGDLSLSKGKLAGLEKKFSMNTAEERNAIWNQMIQYPFMHIDGTTVRLNGSASNVIITTSPAGTLLFQRDHKGFEAVKGTPAEEYDHTLVHDGESTFFRYGSDHQLCLVHELRYLIDSSENEPKLTWAGKMHELLQSSIHIANEARYAGNQKLDILQILSIENQYKEIIQLAVKEYEENPPNMKYYPNGYNTMKRLSSNQKFYLRFLHNLSLPDTNNAAEGIARKEKMHSKQSGGYRSSKHIQYHCDVLSVIESKQENNSRYQAILSGLSKH